MFGRLAAWHVPVDEIRLDGAAPGPAVRRDAVLPGRADDVLGGTPMVRACSLNEGRTHRLRRGELKSGRRDTFRPEPLCEGLGDHAPRVGWLEVDLGLLFDESRCRVGRPTEAR